MDEFLKCDHPTEGLETVRSTIRIAYKSVLSLSLCPSVRSVSLVELQVGLQYIVLR